MRLVERLQRGPVWLRRLVWMGSLEEPAVAFHQLCSVSPHP